MCNSAITPNVHIPAYHRDRLLSTPIYAGHTLSILHIYICNDEFTPTLQTQAQLCTHALLTHGILIDLETFLAELDRRADAKTRQPKLPRRIGAVKQCEPPLHLMAISCEWMRASKYCKPALP